MLNKLKEIFPKIKDEFMFRRPMPNGEKQHTVIELVPSPVSIKSGSKLPQAIVFDPVPLATGGHITMANLYTHIVNPLYIEGQYNITTLTETLATITTMEYVFKNRVEYFIIVLVQSCIYKIKDRFRDINELELYNRIMARIDTEFGQAIYYLKSYVGDEAIVTKETIPHMTLSIDSMVYNCLLDSLIGYPLDLEDHDFITSIMSEFDIILCDYFDDYILREVETVYKPQVKAAIEKGEEFYGLNTF